MGSVLLWDGYKMATKILKTQRKSIFSENLTTENPKTRHLSPDICKRKGTAYSGIIHIQDCYGLRSCACLCEQCPR